MTKYIVIHVMGQLIYISTPGVTGIGKRFGKEDEPYALGNMYE